jgi:DnaJ domain
LNPDLSRAYELLGVKPGVSNRELKAAHRDLAKVWHPDRFLHDPRLQEKALQKLKEINEAYELLSSGRTPRSAPARSSQTVYSPRPARTTPHRRSNWQWAAVPLLLFLAVFAVTTRALLQQRNQALDTQAEQPSEVAPESPKERDQEVHAAAGDTSRRVNPEGSAPEAVSTEALSSEPTPALATVTVIIDPESGLLAKSDCPVRSRMTYPSGNEPSGICNINHMPPPKESRLKSLTTKIFPQGRKDAKRVEDPE